MTVYELIQELSQYNAETQVRFHVDADLDIDVEAQFDRNNENDTQDVTVTADIDEDFEFDDISDYENARYGMKYIQINLTY